MIVPFPKAALHIHNPDLMEGINGFFTAWHALATKSHCHVLRLVRRIIYLSHQKEHCTSVALSKHVVAKVGDMTHRSSRQKELSSKACVVYQQG